MPRERESITHKFSIAGHEGYITAGKYEDGSVGEIFLTDIGKEGSTMRGLLNAFATAISLGLQYGVPLEDFVRKFSYMRFEPEGITSNPEIPFAKSMPDYIMRWVASRFIDDTEVLEDLGILTPEVRAKREAETTQLGLGIDTSGGTRGTGQRRRQRERQVRARRGGLHRNPAGGPGEDGGPRARPGLRAVRRHDAAHGLLLHVQQLRQQHRLRLRSYSRRLAHPRLRAVQSTVASPRARPVWALRPQGRLAEDYLGVAAGVLGDRAAQDPLGSGIGRADLVALDQLLEHDRHLVEGEGCAEAAAHAAAEGDPGVGAGRLLEEALGQEALGVGIDLGVAVN